MCIYVCFMLHLRRFKYNNSMDASRVLWPWEYISFLCYNHFVLSVLVLGEHGSAAL